MTREEVINWMDMDNLDISTLLEDKFDDAIAGHDCIKIIYNVDKMIKIAKENMGMNDQDALDYLEENCFSKNKEVIYMMTYNKEDVDNHIWFKKIFNMK